MSILYLLCNFTITIGLILYYRNKVQRTAYDIFLSNANFESRPYTLCREKRKVLYTHEAQRLLKLNLITLSNTSMQDWSNIYNIIGI